MLVDVFTVQSSVIICRCRRPIDLYYLAATPPAVSEFSPESLDRDSVNGRESRLYHLDCESYTLTIPTSGHTNKHAIKMYETLRKIVHVIGKMLEITYTL